MAHIIALVIVATSNNIVHRSASLSLIFVLRRKNEGRENIRRKSSSPVFFCAFDFSFFVLCYHIESKRLEKSLTRNGEDT